MSPSRMALSGMLSGVPGVVGPGTRSAAPGGVCPPRFGRRGVRRLRCIRPVSSASGGLPRPRRRLPRWSACRLGGRYRQQAPRPPAGWHRRRRRPRRHSGRRRRPAAPAGRRDTTATALAVGIDVDGRSVGTNDRPALRRRAPASDRAAPRPAAVTAGGEAVPNGSVGSQSVYGTGTPQLFRPNSSSNSRSSSSGSSHHHQRRRRSLGRPRLARSRRPPPLPLRPPSACFPRAPPGSAAAAVPAPSPPMTSKEVGAPSG